MKLLVGRDAAFAALGRLQTVVDGRSTIPIINNVLLRAVGHELALTTTDLDTQITDAVACEVEEAGAITVEAKLLYDLFRNLPPGGEVSIAHTPDDPRVAVSCGRSRFRLPALPAGDFPVFSDGKLKWCATLPAAELKRLLDLTVGFASVEDTGQALCGVCLHVEERDGQLRLCAAATNRHRLAKVHTGAAQDIAGAESVVLPAKAVRAMVRLLDDLAADIELEWDAARVRLHARGGALTSKVIDYPYPDYDRVIPRDNDKIVRLPRGDLERGIKRVALIGEAKTSTGVKLELSAGQLVMTVRDASSGQGTEEMPVEYDGPDLQLAFDARLLLDTVSQVGAQTVELRLADCVKGMLVLDDLDPDALFIVSPRAA